MKFLSTIIIAIFFGTAIMAAEPTPNIRVITKGVVCSFCAQGLKKSFKAEPAVNQITFDSEFNYLDLELKKGQSISDEDIRKVVTDAGYIVEKIIRETPPSK